MENKNQDKSTTTGESPIGKLIDKQINTMSENFGMNPRKLERFSFGNRDQCRELFENAFVKTDRTIREYKHLKEYDQVIDYLVDTKGKGLLLTGDLGRGKSNIIRYVIPILFHLKGKVLKSVHSSNMKNAIDDLISRRYIGVDEVGEEPITVDYGERYEAFNRIVNAAEDDIKLLFISTNLSGAQLDERYGSRTIDRIERLCHIIKFNGESLRPK